MISSELEEVLGMSDRVMVMHEGHSTQTLDIKDATQESIMALATGTDWETFNQPKPEASYQ
jgi:ABC-type sugar transport system ATPase subunit